MRVELSLLFPLITLVYSSKLFNKRDKESCPPVCEPEKCPNIGPIKLNECPEPYITTDKCGCCKKCDINPVTTTLSPNKRDEVCEQVKCPKKKLCMLNMQGLPVCKCPSEELCKKVGLKKRSKVCGSDGVTYATRCHLKVASCKSDKKIRVESRGECAVTPDQENTTPVSLNWWQSIDELSEEMTTPKRNRAERKNKRKEGKRLARKQLKKQRKSARRKLRFL